MGDIMIEPNDNYDWCRVTVAPAPYRYFLSLVNEEGSVPYNGRFLDFESEAEARAAAFALVATKKFWRATVNQSIESYKEAF